MNGLRVNAQAIPVATSMRPVCAAIQVAWVNEARNSSGAQTQSMPAASARFVSSVRSSAVIPIAAIEIRSRAGGRGTRGSIWGQEKGRPWAPFSTRMSGVAQLPHLVSPSSLRVAR